MGGNGISSLDHTKKYIVVNHHMKNSHTINNFLHHKIFLDGFSSGPPLSFTGNFLADGLATGFANFRSNTTNLCIPTLPTNRYILTLQANLSTVILLLNQPLLHQTNHPSLHHQDQLFNQLISLVVNFFWFSLVSLNPCLSIPFSRNNNLFS